MDIVKLVLSWSCDKEPTRIVPEEDEEPCNEEPCEDPFEDLPAEQLEIGLAELFVNNLPMSCHAEDLKRLFSTFGYCNISVTIGKDVTGLNKGYGFVNFPNAVDAAKAVESMKGYTIQGMPMEVEILKGARSKSWTPKFLARGAKGAKLFVENLPLDTTRAGLIKMFQDFGSIATADLVKYMIKTNKVNGYVIFSSAAEAAKAMAARNGSKIGVNTLRVTIVYSCVLENV